MSATTTNVRLNRDVNIKGDMRDEGTIVATISADGSVVSELPKGTLRSLDHMGWTTTSHSEDAGERVATGALAGSTESSKKAGNVKINAPAADAESSRTPRTPRRSRSKEDESAKVADVTTDE